MHHDAVDRSEPNALDHRDLGAELRGREDVDLDFAAGLFGDELLQRLMALVIHAADRLVVTETKLGLGVGAGGGGRRRNCNAESKIAEHRHDDHPFT